ncbi:hypothetical protein ALI22I_20295 [Saccharothrix sp. ALI-22-I]|uniref:hypothetical protein n=1 Tax=Saccharothrix sp. ALI-22-I TaxID=1933778 RepID=UPI00097BB145|nr:hypothetical protein [Saccharothrix sp. ALI-22-I]ONI88081.1 hypothetical protein ALI22I_20295 [Saccharothrix sp. ALI-22-I]
MNPSRDPVDNLAHAMRVFIQAAGRAGHGDVADTLPVLDVVGLDTLLRLSDEVRAILFGTAHQGDVHGREKTPLFDAVVADLEGTGGTKHGTLPDLQCRPPAADAAWPTVDQDALLNV